MSPILDSIIAWVQIETTAGRRSNHDDDDDCDDDDELLKIGQTKYNDKSELWLTRKLLLAPTAGRVMNIDELVSRFSYDLKYYF
jgi:hypothetical protein